MTCEYKDKCWRNSYTRYLKTEGAYKDNIPPTRQGLFFQGYAEASMMEFRQKQNGQRNYFNSIFAEVMPMPDDNSSYCPIEQGSSCESCHEHKREKGKENRRVERKKDYEKKYPNAKKRTWIPRHVRIAVSKRDKYTCVYCGCRLAFLKSIDVPCAVDHVVPLALGGKEAEEGNLAFSCKDCNRAKSTEIWEFGCMIGKCGHHGQR